MSLRKKFAEKMLNEKLDFLPLKESYELFKSDEKVEQTTMYWMYNDEEIYFEEDEDYYDMKKVKKAMKEIEMTPDGMFFIWNFDSADEDYNVEFCPCPTYIDLIK